MIEEQLIEFETAKLAREKGFNEIQTNGFGESGKPYYGVPHKNSLNKKSVKGYSRPTQSFLQRWLREVHKIDISIEPVWGDFKKTKSEYIPWVYPKDYEDEPEEEEYFKTYEKALEHALIEALELIKVKKKFYRVCNEETLRGLWYDYQGSFTGIIHEDFDFCTNSSLKMDFDPELVGWLSATDNLEDLYKWFTESDIKKLQNFGWYIHEFEAEDYKFYEKFQHLIIKQDTSKVIKKIQL